MSSSTTAALRKPQSLAELLDARPDTREMISANLNLAHACLLLKQGESEEVERALKLAQKTVSPGLASISRCIRAEALRIAGHETQAWEMAEELANEDRFDVVASLYLRHLFPLRKASTDRTGAFPTESVMAAPQPPAPPPAVAASPSSWETSLPPDSSLPAEPPPPVVVPVPAPELLATLPVPAPELLPTLPVPAPEPLPTLPVSTPEPLAVLPVPPEPPPSQSPEPVVAAFVEPTPIPGHDPLEAMSVSEQVSVVQDQDSEIALPLDEAAPSTEAVGEFPAALRKVAEDTTVEFLRHRSPDGSLAEIVRGHVSEGIESLLVERNSLILKRLGFGSLVHASFEGAAGAAHSWSRGGRTLLLAVKGAGTAPALAARCTRTMEELR